MTHSKIQPGLHEHSWKPEDDLMKRYIVWKELPGGGKLAVRSFHGSLVAELHALRLELETGITHTFTEEF